MRHLLFIVTAVLILTSSATFSQTLGELTVEKIMRDPKWIGSSPSGVNWSPDGKTVYFFWNPDKAPADSLYKITLQNRIPQKVSKKERLALPPFNGVYNRAFTKMAYEKNGDLFLYDIVGGKVAQLTNTVSRESGVSFSGDEKRIIYSFDQNLYARDIASGTITQLTDFRKGKKNSSPSLNDQEKWLRQDQLTYMQVVKDRNDRQNTIRKIQKGEQPKRPKEIYTDDKSVDMSRLTPDGNFVVFRLSKSAPSKNTIVPNYVTASGFTEDISGRTKVGAPLGSSELFVYDIKRDTVLQVKTDSIPESEIRPRSQKVIQKRKTRKRVRIRSLCLVSFHFPIWFGLTMVCTSHSSFARPITKTAGLLCWMSRHKN